jgi:aryl-alcohol dehydrogenase-like predicted oxidoreductase
MGVLVWGPLNSGWLTGKYRRGTPAGARATRWPASAPAFDPARPPVQAKLEAVEALAGLADEAGLPLAHLALAWTLEHPAVTAAIIGPRTMEQLHDLVGADDVRLDADVLDRIDAVVPPGTTIDPPSDTGWRPPWVTDPARRRRPR